MVALPPVANVLKVLMSGTYFTAEWANIYHVKYQGTTPAVADLHTFNTAMRNAWNTNVAPAQNTHVSLTQVVTTDLSSVTGARAVDAVTATGTIVTVSPLTAQAAVVISWNISRRYRGGHPRSYWVAPGGDYTASVTNWSAGYLTTAAAAAANFRTAVNAIILGGAAVILGCVQYYSNRILLPVPNFEPFQGSTVHSRVDTMRRRLGKEIS